MHGCWSIDISKLPLMNDDIANPIVWIFLFPSLSLSLMLGILSINVSTTVFAYFTLIGALLLDPEQK